MKYLLLVILLTSSVIARALEIDEKLTLRFLKVSNSKKTILINRGSEDGLVIGDHAKFFITEGVIARGVAEKVSPSRSIWSLYRVVDPNEITDGKVLNLKIASPVKITEDPSKSMKNEEVPAGIDKIAVDDTDKKELDDLGAEEDEKSSVKKEKNKSEKTAHENKKEVSMEEVAQDSFTTSKNWEIWGMLYLNSLSGSVSNPSPSTTSSTMASSSTADFSAGIERYFFASSGFLKNISVAGIVHKRTMESGQDIKVTTDWFEYGAGVNYHFYNPANSISKLIGFGSLNGGIGSATLKDQIGDTGTPTETKGTSKFISAGVGAKYITSSGFGLRTLLDYYSSGESYSYSNNVTVTRTLAGPRIQVGLSYRF